MWWMIRRLQQRQRRGEQGAVAVLVAIVVVVVLIPIAAIAIDVGAVWAERRQQQNGADAAALAVAQTCVAGTCDSGTGATSTAGALADSNANDNAAQVDLVCGTETGLSPCPAPTGRAWDCPPASGTNPYVQVYTSVLTSDGKRVLPPWFGRVVLGPSYAGTAVQACARAAVGPAGSLTSTLPLTISLCEWNADTSNGTDFAPPPPYGTPPTYPTSYWHVITFHTQSPVCDEGPSGADLPGGFGWLDTSTYCNTQSSADGWYGTSTGVSPPTSCDASRMQQMQGQVVDVPVFDNLNQLNGNNGQYHIKGFAAFFLTGYSIQGKYTLPDLVTGNLPCKQSAKTTCISGWFTSDLVPDATPGSGANMGAQVIGLTG